ncbi:hypothetical protein F5Y18DRAFT_429333 [Xylariaceae sp. FL1019]|nr:hypothetical protein F5Y18DRAFT_429333 [Xylariaceae sp. FL1019]
MHQEWLAQLTPKEMDIHPDFVMERYFLSDGQPDATKTSSVVGIPFDPNSTYHAGHMRDAASVVTGLHQATGHGCTTETVFLGWDRKAVANAAKDHVDKEKKEMKAANEELENERAEEHADYVKTLSRRKEYSPVGSYIIDCEEIETQWPDQARDMLLQVFETDTSGVFEAEFEFGVVEGAMILSTDLEALVGYMAGLEQDEESEDEEQVYDEEDDEEDEGDERMGNKRKAATTGSQSRRGRPAKKSKTTGLEFHVRARGRETCEGEIFFQSVAGSIEFENEKMVKFSGVINLPCVGEAVPFTGRKTTDEVHGERECSWADFSEKEYEKCKGWTV